MVHEVSVIKGNRIDEAGGEFGPPWPPSLGWTVTCVPVWRSAQGMLVLKLQMKVPGRLVARLPQFTHRREEQTRWAGPSVPS